MKSLLVLSLLLAQPAFASFSGTSLIEMYNQGVPPTVQQLVGQHLGTCYGPVRNLAYETEVWSYLISDGQKLVIATMESPMLTDGDLPSLRVGELENYFKNYSMRASMPVSTGKALTWKFEGVKLEYDNTGGTYGSPLLEEFLLDGATFSARIIDNKVVVKETLASLNESELFSQSEVTCIFYPENPLQQSAPFK